jgi:hypothetical protein
MAPQTFFADQSGLQVGHRRWIGSTNCRTGWPSIGISPRRASGDPRRTPGLHLRTTHALGGLRALTGKQIDNFPQAFTHLPLIDAAITLDEALNRRQATVGRLGLLTARSATPIGARSRRRSW